ncbi:Protein of unknown function [Pyronema omphalodes CBS 100304]|uniref:Uncharacterized protein n=1 Tax=Pyronema omphalodes (strain CBS 100304) TaxID=1076935 RepID=U4LIF5_PYROM|nr:Protein of unknown function [Pyronema omphalodes CBS 100304]
MLDPELIADVITCHGIFRKSHGPTKSETDAVNSFSIMHVRIICLLQKAEKTLNYHQSIDSKLRVINVTLMGVRNDCAAAYLAISPSRRGRGEG